MYLLEQGLSTSICIPLPRDSVKTHTLLQEIWSGAEAVLVCSQVLLLLLATDHTLSSENNGVCPGCTLESPSPTLEDSDLSGLQWGLGNGIFKSLSDDLMFWNVVCLSILCGLRVLLQRE